MIERYFKKRYTPFDGEIKDALKANRLLIISQFSEKIKRGSIKTAMKRNELMCKIADEIFIAHASKGGKIEALLSQPDIRLKKFYLLTHKLQVLKEDDITPLTVFIGNNNLAFFKRFTLKVTGIEL